MRVRLGVGVGFATCSTPCSSHRRRSISRETSLSRQPSNASIPKGEPRLVRGKGRGRGRGRGRVRVKGEW